MRALITGASSGIGREMALYLSEQDIDLVLVARDKEKLEEVQSSIKTKSEIICMDLSDIENCIELYKKVGEVDILINNAGFGACGDFTEIDLGTELNMIATNICAVHTLTKLFLNDMKKRNYGYILNVASIAGFLPGPKMSTYHATKSYVLKLTQSIYEELEQEGYDIKISALCPGPVKTNFNSVAGVNFNLSSLDAKYVARYAIDEVLKKRKLVIVPGFKVRMGIFFSRFLSIKRLLKTTYNIQRRKK